MPGDQVQLYDQDVEKLQAIATAIGRNPADVVAKFLRELYFQCPECGVEFYEGDINQDMSEIDVIGVALVDFAQVTPTCERINCPQCGEQIQPLCILG